MAQIIKSVLFLAVNFSVLIFLPVFLSYKFLRIKANLYTNQGKKIKHRKHHDWTDGNNKPDEEVKICILNFTTCNGATVIKDKEVKSKENQMIFFSNTDEHYGITQDDKDSRILLNIVYR